MHAPGTSVSSISTARSWSIRICRRPQRRFSGSLLPIATMWSSALNVFLRGIGFVLGHALYMKAIHGGKAKNDKIDAHKIAVLLRGGMLPQAYVYPAEMRATRDLLRRRCHLVQKRAELLAHIQNTNSQYNLPEIGKRLAYKTNREGVAEHFPDPSVRKTIAVDVSLIDHYDQVLGEVELYITRSAKTHDMQTFARL